MNCLCIYYLIRQLLANLCEAGINTVSISASILTFYLSGEDPRFYKRGIDQYPARLSGGLQSPTEINAQLRNAPQEHCYACIGTRGCAVIRFGRCQLTLTRIPRQFSRARIESSSRNTRVFRHEIRAQSETRLHREYNLAMKNKSLSYTMLHWSIVTHA